MIVSKDDHTIIILQTPFIKSLEPFAVHGVAVSSRSFEQYSEDYTSMLLCCRNNIREDTTVKDELHESAQVC